MKTLYTLVSAALVVSLLRTVHLSNPDSEIVQDTSSDDSNDQNKSIPTNMEEGSKKKSSPIRMKDDSQIKSVPIQMEEDSQKKSTPVRMTDDNQKKSLPIQMEEDSQKKSTNSQGSHVLRNVRVRRPIIRGIEMLSSGGLRMIYSIPYSGSYYLHHSFKNRRPGMVLPTDDKSSDKTDNNNRSVTPDVSFTEESSQKPLDVGPEINTSSGGAPYYHKFQPPFSSNGTRPYGNEQSDTRDQNIRPTSYNGQIPYDNALFNRTFGVSGINESISNIRPNHHSPPLHVYPPSTLSTFNINRDIFNRDEVAYSKRPASSSGNTQNPVERISPDLNLFAGIINDFSLNLFGLINLRTNFVISPLSLFIALSTCYLGSDGSTKTELEEALGLNKNAVLGDRVHQNLKDLVLSILTQSPNYELYLANGMFLGKNITVNAEFVKDIQRFYNAEVKNVDFENKQLSMPVINEWVSRNTGNMIPSISDQAATPMTRLLLLNAIFFKGIWKTQFPKNMTFDGRFLSSEGIENIVPMMPLYGETFPYYRSEEHRTSFIKLPYEGDQISMIIALPFTMQEKPMRFMTDAILRHVRGNLTKTKINTLTIPKFRFDYTRSFRGILPFVGISHLFNPNTINLSKMRSQNDVLVSDIVQKVVIDINEQGTSASAVTAVRFVPLSYRNTTDFIVSHPFAFFILHEPSGLVLFHGKINDIGRRRDAATNNRSDSNQRRTPLRARV